MSTDYEFRCVACNDSCGQDNWRTPEQLEALLPCASHFAAIGRVSKEKQIWLSGWDAYGSVFPGLFHFFAEHEGHDVRVFDEYGRDWSRRDEMCVCGHIYHDHFNHDGMRQTCVSRGSEPGCQPHVYAKRESP